MKTYVSPAELRLVGKAYEIRWKLHSLLEEAECPHETLSARLTKMCRRPASRDKP